MESYNLVTTVALAQVFLALKLGEKTAGAFSLTDNAATGAYHENRDRDGKTLYLVRGKQPNMAVRQRSRKWLYASVLVLVALVSFIALVSNPYSDSLANGIDEYLRANRIIVETRFGYQPGYGATCVTGYNPYYPNCFITITAVYASSRGFASVEQDIDGFIRLLGQYGIDRVFRDLSFGRPSPTKWVGGIKEPDFNPSNPRYYLLVTLEVYR